ncbi:RagB/SusD family nutrient uptake outer membrane protein [Pedobacter sp. L105]|uniref:RagB/SusD family nutrient uptake outer membrane protein n=1 Tax=Pedobacter sp. L105 TaxID=1641871 RepID=UPI00131E1864|nr:RagB/SusD family nutrient uptake outer membrane protein [Pedobacter sp. L105]
MKKNIKNICLHHFKNGVAHQSLLLIIGLIVLSFFNSCKKLTEANPPGAQLVTTNVFKDSVTVQSAIAGMYLVFAPTGTGSAYRLTLSTLPAFSADEMQFVGNTFDTFINNGLISNDGNVASIWNNSYSAIYNANSIIEGIATSSNLSVRFQNQALAEARFIRAFSYFYLVNLFGDVPLVLSTNVSQNSTLPKTPVADIYKQITADLKFAQSNLPSDYSISAGTRTRANKWIATAMLARVDLYTSNWADAETQATTVINNSLFTLPTDLTKVFTPTSTEAIWQLYNDQSGYTVYASIVLPSQLTKIPAYVLNPDLVSHFEVGDARKTNWTNTLVYGGVTYTYPYKYKSVTSGANAEYYTILRLAEQYLIRAEARANQNNVSGAVADINIIRARARITPNALPDYQTTISKDACLAAIAQERRIEFNCEWGHRWLDLKRTGTVNAVIGALKPTFWKPSAALYPIPSAQTLLDNNLTQNPGYN